jgi:hypothetical protein
MKLTLYLFLVLLGLSANSIAYPRNCATSLYSEPYFKKEFSRLVLAKRNEFALLKDTQLAAALYRWVEKRIESKGYLPGLSNSPDEPRNYYELTRSIPTHPLIWRQVFANGTIKILKVAYSFQNESGERLFDIWNEREGLFDSIMLQEFTKRKLKELRDDPANLRAAFEINEKLLNTF